jgi:hypothetical protein
LHVCCQRTAKDPIKLALHKVVQAEDVAEKTRIVSLAHYIALHVVRVYHVLVRLGSLNVVI